MKAIITGLNGTVAPIFEKRILKENWEVIPWNREIVNPENKDDVKNFILNSSADWLFHFALGSPEWCGEMASICFEKGIDFFYASSVSVFSGKQNKPITKSDIPDASDDYGKYKIECEQIVRQKNPNSLIARLGWQIGSSPGSNNMTDYLHKKNREDGKVFASVNWYPACSFLDDTAEALFNLAFNKEKGIFHLDGNSKLNFYEISVNLNSLFNLNLKIEPSTAPIYDNRMFDKSIKVKNITERFTNPLLQN